MEEGRVSVIQEAGTSCGRDKVLFYICFLYLFGVCFWYLFGTSCGRDKVVGCFAILGGLGS